MTDELNEMARANPVPSGALDRVVAIDRRELLEMLEADSQDRRPSQRGLGVGSSRSATRVGYVGALVAAAAVVLIGFALIGPNDSPVVTDVVESVEEATPTTPLVVDATTPATTSATAPTPATTPTSSTAPTASSSVSSAPTSMLVLPPATSPPAPAPGPGPPPPVSAPVSDGPFDRSLDLLSLHYDHAHLDDGHAAAAALEIVTSFGLATHVVSGTHSVDYDGYVHDFESVMRAIWGDRWLDAHLDWTGSVNGSVDRWLMTLDAGGRVWVAEGGVSDFTAEVVREIQRRRPALDTRAAIHVVQHIGRNEYETLPSNLQFVTANTSYERIDDGNSANGTADLNQPSAAFETAALAGPHRTSWQAAFNYFPAAQLDFSDTVEVLHIVGVGVDEVADPDDFAERFLR